MSTFWASITALTFASIVSAQSTLSLQFSSTLQGNVSDYIDPSFAGFGIEPSNLFSFTGGADTNDLSVNLLKNLASYTGKPPHIRLGGNTQDYMIFRPNQDEYAVVNNPNAVGAGAFAPDSMIIGPRFFEAANRFPNGTPVSWGLNMGYNEPDYVQQIVQMAAQVLKNVPNLNIVSFEIGNEPDLYAQNGFRTSPWSGQTYTEEWLARADAVWKNVLQPNGLSSNFFEPGCTASTIGTDFQIYDLTTFGIEAQANDSDRSYISTWNQHDYYYYIGVSTYGITLDHFMTLSTTNDQFAAWVTQVQQAHDTPYPYALREMGVVGPIGLEGITNVFGAALWTLNFFLYAATLNITSVQMHMTDNSNASAWQPIQVYDRQPFVRPNYYGFAAFDQIIGSSCQAQVAGYEITDYPENYNGRVNAYSIMQNGKLDTIVIINALTVNASEANKASLTVQLSLPSDLAGQTLHVSYLTADGADSTEGTTWNGISFEQNSDGTPSTVDDTDRTVTIGDDGSATLTVRDSEAVAAAIGRRIGTGLDADETACAAIASRSQSSQTRSSNGTSTSNASNSGNSDDNSGATHGVPFGTMVFGMVVVALMTGPLLVWT